MAYVLTPARTDALACGGFIALCFGHPRYRAWLLKYSGFLASALFAILALWFAFKEKLGLGGALGLTFLSSLLAILYALIVFRAAALPNRFLRWKWLRQAGRYSYAAYVIHFPLFMAFLPLFKRSAPLNPLFAGACFLLFVGATFSLAALSWHCFEKRILAWKAVIAP